MGPGEKTPLIIGGFWVDDDINDEENEEAFPTSIRGQYYPIHQDDFGPRWNIRLAWAVFLPSLVGN